MNEYVYSKCLEGRGGRRDYILCGRSLRCITKPCILRRHLYFLFFVFDVLLTVQLSIFILVINQLDAQNFCFTISLFHASTCFKHHVLIIRRSKLYYTASGIITLCRWPSGARDGHLQSVMIPKAV